ncbi:vanillate O-demethylase ferredoxin subunit [Sphaerotilus hippei]|uniref:Vanillate O-demethylase ferredoxin subunit n=1 Tax=Sphaerotilus hippei TaxID=744406 RepID=A0A318H5S3_9BURK|nr:PDR/VanB family oxidoreductase [Sphaerotilus hippei]PXW92304.1 vanillate O-demethylase ferredoxin subunit [Sphaerotilus hippei]
MSSHTTDRLSLRVTRRDELTPHIAAFELRRDDGGPLPPFEAGAHIDVELPDGSGRVRSYSLCHAPSDRHRYLIAVQCEAEGRGGSLWLHRHVAVGDTLRVGPPRHLFALRDAPHVLLLAGGIGLTPLLSMAETLWADGRSFALHCAVRSRDRLPFAERLATAAWADRVSVHADIPAPGPAARPALDLRTLLERAPQDTLVCACGPGGFMAAVQQAARTLGWADERVVIERFAPPAESPVRTAAAAGGSGPDGSFELLWAPTGRTLRVAAHESAAQALQGAGLPVDLSCEQGICGQCCLQVIDGQPEHHDLVLSDAERARGDRFTPCCSRATSSRLVVAPLGWRPDLAAAA